MTPEPAFIWDDLQACIPKWWQLRKRYQARRFHKVVLAYMEREDVHVWQTPEGTKSARQRGGGSREQSDSHRCNGGSCGT